MSVAPFSDMTTYRKDFYKKTCTRPPRIVPIPEFKDPITGPLEEHILPYCKYKNLPKNQKKYPDPKEYANQVAEKYPSTRIFLRDSPGGPPDFDVIDKLYENENRSTYMVSYCVLGDYDSKRKRERTTQTLPKDWVVPLTTQRCGYRNPILMAPEGITTFKVKPGKDNLVPNIKEREILEVKTGESVYMSDIGNTGMEIIEGKLHGDVNKRPQFDKEDLLKAKLIRTD